ncbi:hypothetical protein [Labrys wisconsinensis]|uniref:Lipoprotein n=1 Tax=Labrys wisconsinensis TaxID=425677 RepID=A0ABU0J452_9HYPH|nr:hypothetical protein [Labrys wisconsinensis]MDQ0468316.1 hypothetical protein [Labrys wisconsinensis]
MSFLRVAVLIAVLPLAACQTAERPQPVVQADATPLNSKFAQAGDGTVIPDFKPDADAVAYAARCSGGRGGSIAMGMSECDLIGAKGTPSRVVGGLDQQGHTHNAIWYVEGGVRTVYKFDDDKLIDVIK